MPHLIDLGPDRQRVGRRVDSPAAWDALRTSAGGPYALPADRREWEATADARPEIGMRMRALAGWLADQQAGSLTSYGVGTALPELWLHRAAPALELAVTEHAPETVERLRALFTEARVVGHDLLSDPPLDADVHLFHRVDSELTRRQWRTVLARFARCRIVFVATEVYEWRRVPDDLRQLWARRGWTRSGWQRTRAALRDLWQPTHVEAALPLGDLEAWVLDPRQ
jgi:hypothetical protein